MEGETDGGDGGVARTGEDDGVCGLWRGEYKWEGRRWSCFFYSSRGKKSEIIEIETIF